MDRIIRKLLISHHIPSLKVECRGLERLVPFGFSSCLCGDPSQYPIKKNPPYYSKQFIHFPRS